MGKEIVRIGDTSITRVAFRAVAKRAWRLAYPDVTPKDRTIWLLEFVLGAVVGTGLANAATDGVLGLVAGSVGGGLVALIRPIAKSLHEWKRASQLLYLEQFQPILDGKDSEIRTLAERATTLEKERDAEKERRESWSKFRLNRYEPRPLDEANAKVARGLIQGLYPCTQDMTSAAGAILRRMKKELDRLGLDPTGVTSVAIEKLEREMSDAAEAMTALAHYGSNENERRVLYWVWMSHIRVENWVLALREKGSTDWEESQPWQRHRDAFRKEVRETLSKDPLQGMTTLLSVPPEPPL